MSDHSTNSPAGGQAFGFSSESCIPQRDAYTDNSDNSDNSKTSVCDAIIDSVKLTEIQTPDEQSAKLFELARRVSAIRQTTVEERIAILNLWMDQCTAVIGPESYEDCYYDFVEAFQFIRVPLGKSLQEIVKSVAKKPAPAWVPSRFSHKAKLLAGVCRELHLANHGEPFYMGVRTGARLLNVDKKYINRWLTFFIGLKGIELVRAGTMKPRRSAEYRYLGGDL